MRLAAPGNYGYVRVTAPEAPPLLGEPDMTFRTALAVLAGSLTLALAAPVSAQTPADFTKFSEACQGAQAFLIGDLPEGTDPKTILTPLCACITTAFAPFTQQEVDVLAADLRGESTEESHAAFADYAALETKARDGLTSCFSKPEIQSLMPAAPAAP
jgi:hypothetical protein